MAPIIFTGTLPPKKKTELQEIAAALRLSEQGTKDELQSRIKKHLDFNQADLEDDPVFAGLYGRRKRSAQPQVVPPSSMSLKSSSSKSSMGRRAVVMDPVRESTPLADIRDVSTFLKHPISPTQSLRQIDVTTPSSLLPPLPSPTTGRGMGVAKPLNVDVMIRRIKQNDLLQSSNEVLFNFRAILSNSRNIWSLTALCEIIYILSIVIPWKSVQLPLLPKGDMGVSISVNYPPLATFQTSEFWAVILHWAIPALVIPAVVGNLISFSPRSSHPPQPLPTSKTQIASFDPLTASIIRLAAQIAYPFASLDYQAGVRDIDVLGFRLRVLNASVGLAFAFAEAITVAPRMFAKTLIEEQHNLLNSDAGRERDHPNRRALMGEETVVDENE